MNTKKNAAPAVSTEELLSALNEANAVASVPVAPADVLKLAAGTLKLVLISAAGIKENHDRRAFAGAKVVPEYLVIEKGADGKAIFHHAFNFSGEVRGRTHLGQVRPYSDWVPNRIPGTAGNDPTHFVDADDFMGHTYTFGELTLYLNPAAREVADLAPAPVTVAPHLVPLPDMPVPDYKDAELAAAVRFVVRVIGESPPNIRRSGIAAQAAERMRNLAASLYGLGA